MTIKDMFNSRRFAHVTIVVCTLSALALSCKETDTVDMSRVVGHSAAAVRRYLGQPIKEMPDGDQFAHSLVREPFALYVEYKNGLAKQVSFLVKDDAKETTLRRISGGCTVTVTNERDRFPDDAADAKAPPQWIVEVEAPCK